MANVIAKVSQVALVSANSVVIGIRSGTTRLVRLGISDKDRASAPTRCQSSSSASRKWERKGGWRSSLHHRRQSRSILDLSASKIWSAVGDRTAPEEVAIVPAWFMLALASVTEWLFWDFTLGLKKPKVLRRQCMAYTCHPRTYSIKKSRKRLWYEPVDDRDEQVQRSVEWALRMQRKAA